MELEKYKLDTWHLMVQKIVAENIYRLEAIDATLLNWINLDEQDWTMTVQDIIFLLSFSYI